MTLSNLNMTTDRKSDNILFAISVIKGSVECNALLKNEIVCSCKVNIDTIGHIWTIASWFTNKKLQGQGIGKQTLAKALFRLYEIAGIPKEIEYIWNGTNEYVLEWMERHFDAECSCPIAVQKKQADDDWESHIYNLKVGKVLDYFGIK